jgi:hypothetical protein
LNADVWVVPFIQYKVPSIILMHAVTSNKHNHTNASQPDNDYH